MSQRKFFTSTPHKRIYILDTGQTTMQIKKNRTRSPSNVNTDASRVYKDVLRASQDAGSSCEKKKKRRSTRKTSKKRQKETEISKCQNLNKDNSNFGVSDNDENKTGDEFANQKGNAEQKVKSEKHNDKRAKYKLQVNKEIQKLFSQKFSDDKIVNPNHLQNSKTSWQLSNQKNYSKKKCSFTSPDERNKEISGTCEISNSDKEAYNNQNEADYMIDIWNLSEDPKAGKQFKKNLPNEKVITKKSGSVKATTQPNFIVKTHKTVLNSQKVLRSSSVHSSQIYDFPKSPDIGKKQVKSNAKKKKMKGKEDRKNDLAVNQILKVISQAKMEMGSIREKMFKRKTK